MSRDTVASHQRFKAKYNLPFPLIADTESTLCDAFGVTGRSTFLIGGDGKIEKIWPKVSVEGHAEEVLASIS